MDSNCLWLLMFPACPIVYALLAQVDGPRAIRGMELSSLCSLHLYTSMLIIFHGG